ncbi:hypothetical protein HE1_01056 [Holospora elegans E1]|uniref:Uncharacterized protein n=1 Tax=Holospora elegans E1 TaxID=1427503 RepID=A0A023E0W6_9PROT|nr:hypothetical protein HE1_01056 [Holospora elegans E1]
MQRFLKEEDPIALITQHRKEKNRRVKDTVLLSG